MKCSWCADDMSPLMRSDARFCSARCRVAAHRSLPPKHLRSTARWVRWSSKKVPLSASGALASSTDTGTWSTFDEASRSTVGAGLGFVLSDDDRIVCVDIDHCLEPDGSLASWAQELIAEVPNTYIEVSPSGDGLHVWGLADFNGGRRLGNVEIYGGARYMTVTANKWRRSTRSLAEIGDWISSLMILIEVDAMASEPLTKAVRATLRQLEVSATTDARAQLAISLAKKLDEDAGMATAAIARELRATLADLEGRTDGSSDFDTLIAQLSAPMVDSED